MKRRRTGTSLYEMLIALGILVIALDLSAQMFHSLIRTGADSYKSQNQTVRIEAALAKLRRDVWSAAEVSVSDSHSARLSAGGGLIAAWTIKADGLERTGADGKTERWPGVGNHWALAREGASLTISDESSKEAAAVRLPSQVLLAGAAR